MKRKIFLISSMLAAVLLLLSFEGCKKNDATKDEGVVGTWHSEMVGEYDDAIKTDLIINENGEAKFVWSSNVFPEEMPESESLDCKWKVDGKELVFTSSDWDDEELRFEYKLAGNVLTLDPNDNCYFEFTRK